MGTTVCRAVVDDPELELAAAVDPFHAGLDLRQVIGLDVPLQMAADGEAMVAAGVDVAVDFTQLEASRANLEWLADHGIHAVVGTSGFTPDDLDRFASVFTRSNCVIAPNFAIGAVLMMRFAEMAAPYFDTAEIIELHHDRKIDAPSGTAMATKFGDPALGRTPDIIVQPNPGVIYTSSTKKDAEHGGNAPDDSHVALIVSYPSWAASTNATTVVTTQVAPTILGALKLDPTLLLSVKSEGTASLPGITF